MRVTTARRLLGTNSRLGSGLFSVSNCLRASADDGDFGEFDACLFARTIRTPRSLPNLTRHGEPFMMELAAPAEPGLGVRVDAGQQFTTLAPGVASQNLEPVVGREQRTESLLYDPLAVRTHRTPRAHRDTVWHGFPGMSFLAYPLKFRLPAKVDSRQTVTTSGFRELPQFLDPHRTLYRLPVQQRWSALHTRHRRLSSEKDSKPALSNSMVIARLMALLAFAAVGTGPIGTWHATKTEPQ